MGEYGRRVTTLDSLKDDVSLDTSKLQQKAIDFEKIQEEQDLKQDWDIVYIAYVLAISQIFRAPTRNMQPRNFSC